MSDDLMSIGALSQAADITTTAIRYYEEVNLVTSSARVSGQRRFTTETVERISFIKKAQKVGFTLKEIRQIVDESGDWGGLLDRKLVALQHQKEELDQMIFLLEEVKVCGCSSVFACARSGDHDG